MMALVLAVVRAIKSATVFLRQAIRIYYHHHGRRCLAD